MTILKHDNSVTRQMPVVTWKNDTRTEGYSVTSSHWSEPLRIDHVATCRIWNRMELRVEEYPVQIETSRALLHTEELSCKVVIPFVGVVIRFILKVQMDDATACLRLTLPQQSVEELSAEVAILLSVDILPGLGAACSGQPGYLFLPCYAGVLHRFNHDVSRETRLTMYAQQDQWAQKCYFNLFGIQAEGYAWCAMVTQGDHDTQLVVRSHYESQQQYSVHASWVYRWDHSDPIIQADRQIAFHLLESDEQNYNTFARVYRQWLREHRGLKTLAQKEQSRPAMRDFSDTFLLKIMMGYKKADLNGQGTYQSSTTFNQVKQILKQMQAEGLSNITTQLVGWNAEGHDGRYPQRFPVNEDAGGGQALTELTQWAASQKIHMGMHDNYSDSYACGNDFDLDNVIVNRDGSHWQNVPWAGGFNWRLCPLQSLQHAQRDMPKIVALGLKSNGYLDAIGALSTCHSKDHPADRLGMMQGFREIYQFAGRCFDTVSTEVAFGPYFDLIDGVYMSHGVESASKWTDFVGHFVDEHVPALAVILHNGIRYHLSHTLALNGRQGALMDVIWGAMPFIEIAHDHIPGAHAMPRYEDVREYVTASWELCCKEFSDRSSVDLDAIEQISEDCWLTRYADGVILRTDLTQGTVQVV